MSDLQEVAKSTVEAIDSPVLRLNIAVGYPAFSNTTINMFGPLKIRISRKTLKEAQVIIFTSKSGPSRACNRQKLKYVSHGFSTICLNQRIYVGVQSYLNKILQGLDTHKFQNVLSKEFSCSFHREWNIPQASHQNRVVESLIKSGRQALDVSSKNQTFTEEQGRMYL